MKLFVFGSQGSAEPQPDGGAVSMLIVLSTLSSLFTARQMLKQCRVGLLIADLRVPCISLYIPHCTRPGTNINDTSVIRKRNLNGQIRQTAVQADLRLCTRGDVTRDMRKHRRW